MEVTPEYDLPDDHLRDTSQTHTSSDLGLDIVRDNAPAATYYDQEALIVASDGRRTSNAGEIGKESVSVTESLPVDAVDTPPDADDTSLTANESGELPNRSIGFIVSAAGAASAEEWRDSLRQGFEGQGATFKGDLDRAASLMEAFDEGKRYVHETFREKGVELEFPAMGVITDPDPGMEENIWTGVYERTIYVQASVLEELASKPADETVELPSIKGNNILFKGLVSDFFRVTGVEEAHHDAYNQLLGGRPEDVADLSEDAAEYDASEPEWQALRWQNMAARAMGMPEETQQVLRDRMEAAKQLRRAQRQNRAGNEEDQGAA